MIFFWECLMIVNIFFWFIFLTQIKTVLSRNRAHEIIFDFLNCMRTLKYEIFNEIFHFDQWWDNQNVMIVKHRTKMQQWQEYYVLSILICLLKICQLWADEVELKILICFHHSIWSMFSSVIISHVSNLIKVSFYIIFCCKILNFSSRVINNFSYSLQ